MSDDYDEQRTVFHEPWCNDYAGHAGECQSGSGLNPGVLPTPEDRLWADPAHKPEQMHEILPTAVAAGIVADLTSVQGKIPAELHIPVPAAIAKRVDLSSVPVSTEADYREETRVLTAELRSAVDAQNVERAGFGPRFARGGYVPRTIQIHTPIPDPAHNSGTISIETPGESFMRDYANGAKVIALGGYQEHGKDAVADILVERFGFMKIAMSDPVHDSLMRLDPQIPVFDPELHALDRWMSYSQYVDLVGYTKAKENVEVRRLLRAMGTEVGREMAGENVWAEIAEKKIRAALRNEQRIALTGIRYVNEIEMIEALGGTTIWVERPGHPVPDTVHTSENTLGMADFHMPLMNDGTLEDLERTVSVTFVALRAYESR